MSEIWTSITSRPHSWIFESFFNISIFLNLKPKYWTQHVNQVIVCPRKMNSFIFRRKMITCAMILFMLLLCCENQIVGSWAIAICIITYWMTLIHKREIISNQCEEIVESHIFKLVEYPKSTEWIHFLDTSPLSIYFVLWTIFSGTCWGRSLEFSLNPLFR